MALGGGAAELVEGDSEPRIDIAVQDMEAIAELAGRDALLERLGFRGGAVLVGAADVESIVAAQAAEASEDIGGENLDEVSEMRHVIDIGEGRGDKPSFHKYEQ